MKTLIVYTTTHGCAEKCAHTLAEKLAGETTLINLKKSSPQNLADFDHIVIGGSIHAGKIQHRLKAFCEKNGAVLLQKKLGLFLCCMEEGDTALKQFNDNYPEMLRQHAAATGLFGGEFDFERMGFLAKSIIKKMAKIDTSVSKISSENISSFAAKMN